MRDNRQQTLGLALLAAGVTAAAGFIGTAELVRRRRTFATDVKVRTRVPHDATIETPHGRVIEAAQKLGKWYVQGPLAALAAGVLWRGGHRRAAGAISLASASSGLLANLFDEVIFHRPPPPGHPNPRTPSFPSGHAIQLAAVSLTAGYVLMRERIAPAAIAMPLAFGVPIASSGTRLYQDRHWASDVLGGWLAGLALASWCAASYEMVPEARLAEMSRSVSRQARRLGRDARERVREVTDTTRRGARVTAREARRRGQRAERMVARTVERAADGARAAVGRRKPGFLDLAKMFVEDVLAR